LDVLGRTREGRRRGKGKKKRLLFSRRRKNPTQSESPACRSIALWKRKKGPVEKKVCKENSRRTLEGKR